MDERPDASPPHVLIVEDEPAIADNIIYALETEGIRTTWCGTAGEGLACLRAQEIDLILLDVGLPDGNGFDLCREIREERRTPVIFLTARGDEVDRVVGLELGGDDYIVKPFSPRELSARVRAVLRRTREAAVRVRPDRFPFVVDEDRREICYRGRRLELSRYELRLLAVLIRHPGRVYSRSQLMERVWEDPSASMERTVDAHIKSIRAKLRTVDPEDEPIKTHRGLGYSLEEYR